MESKRADYQFDFVVEDVTQEQADHLMDIIIAAVEMAGTQVGGGFWKVDEEEEGSGT